MNDRNYLSLEELSIQRDLLDDHDEESYCNWVVKNRKYILTSSPNSHSYTDLVPYSEELARELEERDNQLQLEKELRADILKLLRDDAS